MTARPEDEERGGVPEPMFGRPVGPDQWWQYALPGDIAAPDSEERDVGP